MSTRALEEWGWVARLRKWVMMRRRQWLRLLDARISLVVIALGGAGLILPQGQDVVRNLVDTANLFLRDPELWSSAPAISSYVRFGYFLLACIWSGLIAWYWPLLLTRVRVTGDEPYWFRILRRLLGLSPLLLATGTIIGTFWGHFRDIWIATAIFVSATILMFFAFKARRRYIEQPHSDRWWTQNSTFIVPVLRRLGGRDLGATRGDDIFVIVTLIGSWVTLLAFSFPGVRADLAMHLGAASIAFGAVGSIIAGVSGTLLLLFGSRLPVLTIGAVLIVLLTPFNDNHRLAGVNSRLRIQRPDLRAAYAKWLDKTKDGPIIIVATAGGASRAAYWTATVLRALDERSEGRFGHQVFAISSVSGGTLGAIGYAAWLADQHIGSAQCPYSPQKRYAFDQRFMGGDYLSPAVAGLLYTDMIQSFIPFPLFWDRASFLEEGWRQEWDQASSEKGSCVPRPGRMSEDYLEIWRDTLWGDAPWVPVVLSNATLVENGKRIITAPIKVQSAVFEDTHDFMDLFGDSVAASTAISNSARFPIVSPAGTIPVNGGATHIVDGGYFENGGLETAYDLARYIRAALDPSRPILIVEINNDDDAPNDRYSDDNLARYPNGMGAAASASVGLGVAEPDPTSIRLAAGPRSIIGALYGTRTSRGVLGAKRLSSLRAVGLTNAYRATFNLGPLVAHRKTAMSWSLSLSSRNNMDDALQVPAPWLSATKRARVRQMQGTTQMTLACQRTAADMIAAALGSPTVTQDGCDTMKRDAQWVGVPLGLPPAEIEETDVSATAAKHRSVIVR